MPPAFHITCLFPSYLASFALTYLASILIHHATVLFGEVLHPLLTFHVLLSVVAGTVDCVEFFFRNELLSGQRAIGIVVDRLELIERFLVASLGGHLPMADPDLMVSR